MIKWFGKSLVTQLVSIIVVAILLWGRAFVQPVGMVEPMGFVPLYKFIYILLHTMPMLASTMGMLLVLLTGYMFNELLYNNKLIPQGNWMPMFLFVIAASCHPQMLTLHPFHLANIVILIGIKQTTLHSAKLTLPANNIAATMSCIVITSLFHNGYIVLLTTLFFLIPRYKIYNWKDISATVLGLLAPIIPIAAYYFITNEWEEIGASLRGYLADAQIVWTTNDWMGWIVTGLFIAILIPAISFQSHHLGEKPINSRKNIAAINQPTLCSILMIPLVGILPLNSSLFAYGWSNMSCSYLNHSKNSKLWNAIFILWIVTSVIHNYIN